MTQVWAGKLKNLGSISGREKTFLHPVKHPNWLWPNPVTTQKVPETKQTVHEPYQSLSNTTKIKKVGDRPLTKQYQKKKKEGVQKHPHETITNDGIQVHECCPPPRLAASVSPSHQTQYKKDRQCMYKHNNGVCLCYHCSSGKAISITYSECVSVALVIQHATYMHHIVTCGLSDATVLFHIISYRA